MSQNWVFADFWPTWARPKSASVAETIESLRKSMNMYKKSKRIYENLWKSKEILGNLRKSNKTLENQEKRQRVCSRVHLYVLIYCFCFLPEGDATRAPSGASSKEAKIEEKHIKWGPMGAHSILSVAFLMLFLGIMYNWSPIEPSPWPRGSGVERKHTTF